MPTGRLVSGLSLILDAVRLFEGRRRRFSSYALAVFLSRDRVFLSVVAVFRNETLFLREWLKVHRLLGVDRFFLFDLGSTDNPSGAIQRFLREGWVILEPAATGFDRVERQRNSYTHAIQKYGDHTQWMAFLDVDEFLFSPSDGSLKDKLDSMRSLRAIFVSWLLFGSSGFVNPPKGGVVPNLLARSSSLEQPIEAHLRHRSIEKKTSSSMTGQPLNGKTVLQPRYVKSMRIHRPTRRYMKHLVNENGITVDEDMPTRLHPLPSMERLRINHYWMRYLASDKARGERHSGGWRGERTGEGARMWDDEISKVRDTTLRDLVVKLGGGT